MLNIRKPLLRRIAMAHTNEMDGIQSCVFDICNISCYLWASQQENNESDKIIITVLNQQRLFFKSLRLENISICYLVKSHEWNFIG